MHLTNTLVPFLLTLASPALAAEGVISKDGLGTAIGGALDPTVTPAPKPAVGAAPAVAGPLTIAVTNSFGAGLSISFQHDSGSPSAINNPTPGPLGGATTIVYPSGWAGRIAVGKVMSVINSGSKIEGSFSPPTYQPNIDVSYGKSTIFSLQLHKIPANIRPQSMATRSPSRAPAAAPS